MIVPDTNLLLYAYDTTAPHHQAAARWWEECMNGAEPVGVPRVVALGFLRLATSPRVFARPLAVEEAGRHIAAWLERPHVVDLAGGPGHVARVVELLGRASGGWSLVTDAQIAAIAIEQGATVFTNDTDFRRFPGLRIENPLPRPGRR